MNESDIDSGVAKARIRLQEMSAIDTSNVGLYREPRFVPASYGYPDRVVVTFEPRVRDFPAREKK